MSRVPRSRSSGSAVTATAWSCTRSSARFATARPSSCSNRSTCSRAWRRWCDAREAICCATTASFPNARHRRLVVPAPGPTPAVRDDDEGTPAPKRTPMSWIQRLRYVFDIDPTRCPRCGAAMRVLAAITDPRVIAAIPEHIDTRAHARRPSRHLDSLRSARPSIARASIAPLSDRGQGCARVSATPISAHPGKPSVAFPLDVSRRQQRSDRRAPALTFDPHPKLRDTALQGEFARSDLLSAET